MKNKKIGSFFGALGVSLFLLQSVGANTFYRGPLSALSVLFSWWWLLVAVGAGLYSYDRFGLSLPNSQTKSGLRRQDIIAATNWSRENKHQIRKSIGIGLLTAGVLAWALSTVLGLGGLKILWTAVAAVGAVLVGLSWRLSRGIKADHSREISVRLPDQIALHTFHVRLRQLVEDKGYAIVSETSPVEGGRTAALGDGVWLSHGSYKARRRPIAEANTLLPEVEDDPYLSKILTAITLGFVSILSGISLTQVSPSPMATDPNTALYDAAHLFGWLFVVVGIALAAYGYVRRTREWGEIYCVEEGTVYESELNLYDEETLDNFDGTRTPNVSAPNTACELVVTLGATCTNLYDEEKLTDDLQSLAEEVEVIAREERHEFFEGDQGLSPEDIDRHRKPSSRSTAE